MSWNPEDIIPSHYEQAIMSVFPADSDRENRCGKIPTTMERKDIRCGRPRGHEGPCIDYYGINLDRPFIAFGEGLEVLSVVVRLLGRR